MLVVTNANFSPYQIQIRVPSSTKKETEKVSMAREEFLIQETGFILTATKVILDALGCRCGRLGVNEKENNTHAQTRGAEGSMKKKRTNICDRSMVQQCKNSLLLLVDAIYPLEICIHQ